MIRRRVVYGAAAVVVTACLALGGGLWAVKQAAAYAAEPAAEETQTNVATATAQSAPAAKEQAEDPVYAGWERPATKWVPIFSLENTGLYLGGAQIAGPSSQVAKVKGVAQLQLTFKGLARIRVYVPVSSISLKLDRVQGVAVWALGDIRVLKL